MKYTLKLTFKQYQEIITDLKDNPTFQKYGIAGMAVSDESFDSTESLMQAIDTDRNHNSHHRAT